MALTKNQKTDLVGKFADVIKGNASVVFLSAKNLSVAQVNEVRNALAAANGGYKVVKKTLLKRVLADSGITGDVPTLDGELAIAFSNDATAPAREVWNFAKKTDGKMAMLGGIFEGKFMDAAQISEIALIPGTDVLRGMFVNVINSPIQGLVIALSKIAEAKA
ncbi:MAG: rplJ [Patescibacteria group bacterium]|nr:rplJ [Patescibacteria group bacterium]